MSNNNNKCHFFQQHNFTYSDYLFFSNTEKNLFISVQMLCVPQEEILFTVKSHKT